MNTLERRKLVVRQANRQDVSGIIALSQRIWGKQRAYTPAMVLSHQRHFAEGQFVAEYDGVIVGHCATFRISEHRARAPHGWDGITGGGLASRHEEDGDMLYGMEVCVDEELRGLRIGQRFYDQRRALCQKLGLKGIIFGGRMPGYAKRAGKVGSPQAYLEAVQQGKMRDPVINFHLRSGFEPIGVLENYLLGDKESMGFAAHMLWRNPLFEKQQLASEDTPAQQARKASVRVAAVQFQARKVKDFSDFAAQVEYFVDIAADYRSDFVLFPELFTMPLLSAEQKRLSPEQSIARITEYTDVFVEALKHMALSYNINIIGGSHPTRMDDGTIENISYIFLRDGSVHAQSKLHPTPSEVRWWKISGGNALHTIDTDCGPIGVLICYDSEFPEATRYLVDQGAQILFVPFCTDERQGYNRVRYCCHARAVENQMYVVLAGVVGNLPDVENMDIHYAESAILTPCDFPFARDGVAATSAPNTEMIVFADLRMDDLITSRASGSVQNLKDRRHDLYKVTWKNRQPA